MRIKLFVSLAFLGFFVWSCSETNSTADDLDSVLTQLIEEDESISLDGMSDYSDSGVLLADEDEDSLLGRSTEDLYEFPIRWVRRVESVTGTVTIEAHIIDADTVYATVDRHITGTLTVFDGDTATVNGVLVFTPSDTTQKPFEMDSQRRVRFRRIGNSGILIDDWVVDGITPVICQSPGSTVAITDIHADVYDLGNDDYTNFFNMPVTGDLLNTFYHREGWPHLTAMDLIRTRVDISNTNPNAGDYPGSGEGVFMHFKRRNGFKGRRALFDDGSTFSWHGLTSHDETENDNEFTRMWLIHGLNPNGENRPCRLFFEVIDYETLLNPEGAYYSYMVGFPYFVQAP
ncbi:MAG: hypothetical protein GXO91_01825 [FCB group bacterium]|nr:hypothetical protein [FCB group bacterium]